MDAYLRAESGEFMEWSIGDLLHHAVQQCPDRIALIVPASADGRAMRSWTYRELEAQAERVAGALLARFAPGDRVATWAAGSAEILLLGLGAALAGIVLVTLNPANRGAEIQYLLMQSEARGLFLDRVYRKMDSATVLEGLRPALPALEAVVYMDEWEAFVATSVSRALPTVAHDAAAMIIFTSGTTGKPKGAMLRHHGLVNNAALTMQQLGIASGCVWLNVLPMFHVGGSGTMTLGCMANLGTQVLLAEFSADAMLAALQDHRVNLTMAVPTMLVAMLESPLFATTDLSALELVVSGGSAVAPELVRKVTRQFGCEVLVLMGQTEASGSMFLTRRGDSEERLTQSVGAPLPLSEAKIVASSDGRTASVGEIGEICIRNRYTLIEYFRLPDKTRETLDAEGWLHTGDLGVMRADGYFQVTGRLKDMIIRGGENIYPREIEDLLAEHPAISQAAVLGLPDEKWGEQVAAAVIAKPGMNVDTAQLILFLQERISRHKVPKFWQVVERFPVNASGKVQKFLLRDQFITEVERK